MPRLVAAVVALAVASSTACVPPALAPGARRVGMVASIVGVVGLIAAAGLQGYTSSGDELVTTFSLMSAGGVVLFAGGELSLPIRGPRKETETEKFRRWARLLTSRAFGAARDGRCPRVRRLEKRVRLYDREVHDFVFMRDPAILKCLEAAEPTNPLPLTPGADADTPSPADPANPPPTLPPPPREDATPTLPSPSRDPPPPTLAPPPRDPPDLRLPPGTVIPPTP